MTQIYAIRIKPGTYPPPLAGGMYVRESGLASDLSFTRDIQSARTWKSYQDAYNYVDEKLYGIADVVMLNSMQSTITQKQPNENTSFVKQEFSQHQGDKSDKASSFLTGRKQNKISATGKNPRTKILFWSLISLAVTVAVGGSIFTTSELTKPCPNKSEKRVWGSCYSESQARLITIGIGSDSPDSDYNALAAYLRNQLGNKIAIDRNTPYEKIPFRIAQKDWDIAFTRSPIFSIAAESNRYTGVAIMFPDQPTYYRAVLYVRADSPIQSIDDIKSTTTIALGTPESAPTFLLPIYALYGKSLRVGTGYRPKDVIEMVKAGKVDIGAARYAAVKDDPALRMIYVSKAIPGAGVYLSPLLTTTERQRLKNALLNAPLEIQAKAHYGKGQIPKYDELKKITFKTAKLIECLDLKTNSFSLDKTVNLFCQKQSPYPDFIEGRVREYKVSNQSNIQLKVVTTNNQVYLVLVPKQILNQIPIKPINTLDKDVQIKNVAIQKLTDGIWSVKLTRLNQLSFL